MEVFLMLVGGGWALIGLWNLIAMPWYGYVGFGVMLNMLLFVIPGLVVYGIGAVMKKRQTSSTKGPASSLTAKPNYSSVESRLCELNSLKNKGFINESEFESRRAEIIKEV